MVVHTAPDMSSLEIVAAEDARLEITEVFLAEAFAEVAVKQSARSLCRLTAVQLTSANASYTIDLDGRDAENMLGGVFLAGGEDTASSNCATNHNVPDCRSNSYIKGVAGGSARGEFCGLVYVAPDAQHTDAQQQNRNILLSETAHIATQPQLEIYADDVKCSHGSDGGADGLGSRAVYAPARPERGAGPPAADRRFRGRRRTPLRRGAVVRDDDGGR